MLPLHNTASSFRVSEIYYTTFFANVNTLFGFFSDFFELFQKKQDAVAASCFTQIFCFLSVSPQRKSIHLFVVEIYVLYQPISKIKTGCRRTACTKKRQCHAHNRQNCQAHSQIENCLCRNHSKKAHTDIGAEGVTGNPCIMKGSDEQENQQ